MGMGNGFRWRAIEYLRSRGIAINEHGLKNNVLKKMLLKYLRDNGLYKESPGTNAVMATLKIAKVQRRPKKLCRAHEPTQHRIDEFYASWEWKRFRYDFIKDKQRRCECCGASPADGVRIVVDHIKPIRHYWHLRLDRFNLQMLCDDCNMGKGSRDETDWRPSNVIPIRSA